MQLGIKLHRASQSIEAAYAAAFAAASIEATPRQIAVLDVIAGREDAPSQTDIVTATNIEIISRALSEIEKGEEAWLETNR